MTENKRGHREIQAAAELAQSAANRNNHKPGWKACAVSYLVYKAREEWDEFLQSIEQGEDRDQRRAELGDAIWTLVMLGDRLGLLEDDMTAPAETKQELLTAHAENASLRQETTRMRRDLIERNKELDQALEDLRQEQEKSDQLYRDLIDRGKEMTRLDYRLDSMKADLVASESVKAELKESLDKVRERLQDVHSVHEPTVKKNQELRAERDQAKSSARIWKQRYTETLKALLWSNKKLESIGDILEGDEVIRESPPVANPGDTMRTIYDQRRAEPRAADDDPGAI